MKQQLPTKKTLRHLATTLALAAMVLFAPTGLRAQTTVTIGTGTVTSNTNPIGTYYNYSITEQLYTEEEIGMAGNITSISFYYMGTAARDLPITVYMENVSATDLSSGISLANATEVFSGTLSVPATAGWVSITLDTPFPYDGTSNLLIGIIKDYLYYFSGQTWQGTTTPTTMARYTQNDYDAYTTGTTPGSGQSNRPNIQLTITPSSGPTCERPADLTVSNITATGATFSWTSTVGNYVFEYKAASADTWTTLPLTSNTTTLTNLQPGTSYNARVKAVCGAGLESGYRTANFMTVYGVPFSESFSTSSVPTNWNRYTGLLSEILGGTSNLAPTTSGWSFGTFNGVLDNHTRVNIYGTSCKYWLVTPTMSIGNNVQLTFDLALTAYSGTTVPAPSTTGTDDKFVVLITTDDGTTWTVLRQWDNEGSSYVYNNITCSATGEIVAIDLSSYAGQSIAVAFYGESTASNADNNLHIDNVSIDYIPACPHPLTLTTSNVAAHTATINWTAGGTETSWNVYLGNTYVATVTNPTYTFTGLTGETAYTASVTALCGTDESQASSVNFTTSIACPVPTGLAATLTPGNGAIATLNWTAGGTETAWVLEYGTASDFTNATSVNVTDTPTANLTGLTAETPYYARVKADCGGDDGQSVWSGTYTFTPTNAYSVIVNDGTSTNNYVPIYGLWVDDITKSTFIIPAADLANLQYGTISKLTFYSSNTSVNWGAAQFEVYMTETTETTVNAMATLSDMTQVMTAGSLGVNNNIMEVTLTTPYQYMGGNLKIAFNQTVSGTYSGLTWYGVTANGASYGGYGTSVSQQNFLPKTRFDYTPGQAPACPRPTQLAVNYTGGTTAQVSWNSDATLWNIKVNGTVTYGLTANPTTLTGLDLGTTYTIQVQANCGGDTSEWTTPVSFTTDLCDTNNMCALTITLTDAYNDGGGQIQVVDAVTNTVLGTYTNSGSSTTYTLNVCNGRTLNFVYASTDSWPYENGWVITDINEEVIAERQGCTGDCDAPTNGVVATYTVNCAVSSCRRPTALAATEIGLRSVQLGWTENGEATSWVVAYAPAGDIIFTELAATTNPYTLTGLNPETAYTVKVRPVCSDQFIRWSDPISFTTLAIDAVPFNLTADVYPTTASLNWEGAQDSYNVRYRRSPVYYFTPFNTDEDRAGWTYSSVIYGLDDPVYNVPGSSNYFLSMGWNTTEEDFIYSPELPAYPSGSTLEFHHSYYSIANTFQFGYSTTTDDATAFTWSGAISSVSAEEAYSALYSQVLPDGVKYIAFKATASEQAACIFIDNVKIYDAAATTVWNNTVTNVNATTLDITGLTPNTEYEWQAQGLDYDGLGSNTDWSEIATFTTPEFRAEANKWYAIASPKYDDDVSYAESLANITNLLPTSAGAFAYDLFRYNEATSTWENQQNTVHTDFDVFEQARGYIYRRDNTAGITFVGEPNTGNISIDLTADADGDLQGFNLVGNPYYHTYTLNERCYSLTTDGSWEVHPTSYDLSIAEAVMVNTTTARTLTFTENTSSKGSHSAAPALAFTVKGGGLQDVAYASLTEGDGMPKLSHFNESAPVLSIPVNGRRYAIADLGTDCQTFDMTFRGIEGEYTLTLNANLSTLTYCHLIDRATGKDIDLLSNNSYTFTHSNTSTISDRFQVRLTPNVDENATGNFAYWNGNAWVVEGTGTLEVYDVLGRRVFTGNVDSQLSILNSQFPATGVYVLRMGDKNQKIVVR